MKLSHHAALAGACRSTGLPNSNRTLFTTSGESTYMSQDSCVVTGPQS